MSEVPKIVCDRLRAAGAEQALPERLLHEAHPNADQLTAFSERALSATERDGVLEHLAFCGHCREVVALALPAAEVAATPIADADGAVGASVSRAGAPGLHKVILSWPRLHWAALAAGIVVAASVLLLRPGKLNQPTPSSANQQVATAAQPAPGSQIASGPLAPPMAATSTYQPAETARAESRLKQEFKWSKKLQSGPTVAPPLPPKSGMLLAENEVGDNRKDSKGADKASATPSIGARALDSASAIPRSSEVVEVTSESAAVQAEVSSEDRPMAHKDAPAIAKAKPAPQTETNQLHGSISAKGSNLPMQGRNTLSLAKTPAAPSPTPAHAVAWTISAGVLQRSVDSGQSWQNALRADHLLLCYASRDNDVWTGGEAGSLFHSADGGVTWLQLQPSIKDKALSSDVTRIDLRGPTEIVVSTRSNETWSSADGGRTWAKK